MAQKVKGFTAESDDLSFDSWDQHLGQSQPPHLCMYIEESKHLKRMGGRLS